MIKKKEIQNDNVNIWIYFTIGWVIVAPLLAFQIYIITGKETGQLGDTIGGISTPVIGLLSAFLIYKSFKAQIDANAKISEQISKEHQGSNFNYLNSELKELTTKFYEYRTKKLDTGKSEFYRDCGLFSQYLMLHQLRHEELLVNQFKDKLFQTEESLIKYSEFIAASMQFYDELEFLDISNEHKELLLNKFKTHIFYIKNSFNYWRGLPKLEPIKGLEDHLLLYVINDFIIKVNPFIGKMDLLFNTEVDSSNVTV